jgi:excisionase family DNA binding protein
MRVLNVNDLSAYLKLSKSSIYKKVMRREIPFIKATGTLLFNQEEIDQWLNQHSTSIAGTGKSCSNILKPRKNG